jgi:hypothetical protein
LRPAKIDRIGAVSRQDLKQLMSRIQRRRRWRQLGKGPLARFAKTKPPA